MLCASMRCAIRGWWAGLVLFALSWPAAADPGSVAKEVHRRGEYPSELRIRADGDGAPCRAGDGVGQCGGRAGGSAGAGVPTIGGSGSGSTGSGSSGTGTGSGNGTGTGNGNGTGTGTGSGGPSSGSPGGASGPAPASGPSSSPSLPAAPIAAGGSFLSIALLVVVVMLLIAFAVWLVSRMRSDVPDAEVDADGGEKPDEKARQQRGPRVIDGDPDALAAAGRLDEAIAALLYAALRKAGWDPRRDEHWTAREVVRGVPVADPRRAPLARIVNLAESVHFGGADPDRSLYDSMRAEFGGLRAGGGGGAAPA